ncbi:B3 domain-containing protein Os03g0184500 [Zea mays]|uniref:B3 domain-containing protein n=1 Tax=Zea mays TaxID=4577 RepID=K7VPP2_MAIZE|eukprot:XP_020400067.1 B3 domain-containing protein Os03g0184500 [Zea mays]
MVAAAAETQWMSPYEVARERNVEENKRKMEALNLRHLSAVIKEAPKTPSPMKPKRRRPIEDAVVVPSPPRRSRRLANLPELKYAEIAPHTADRMTRSPRKPACRIYFANRGSISMKARLEATRKAEELESELDHEIPSFVKAMLHSHVVRGFWLQLPSHFCDTYMPKQDSIITLVDEKDEEFDTKYLAYKKGLSGGWAGFALCHGMQDGDSAVFQLIKPTTFKVYIIRAASDDVSEVDE